MSPTDIWLQQQIAQATANLSARLGVGMSDITVVRYERILFSCTSEESGSVSLIEIIGRPVNGRARPADPFRP